MFEFFNCVPGIVFFSAGPVLFRAFVSCDGGVGVGVVGGFVCSSELVCVLALILVS